MNRIIAYRRYRSYDFGWLCWGDDGLTLVLNEVTIVWPFIHSSCSSVAGPFMDPYPVAILGAVTGWFIRFLFGESSVPVPISSVPTTCSCTCECPIRTESGDSWPWILVLLLTVTSFALGVAVCCLVRFGQGHKPEIVYSPGGSKGKKGLGVVGKTLELTSG